LRSLSLQKLPFHARPACCYNSAFGRQGCGREMEKRVARTLCVANQKGGVGKTTTAVNLAGALAMAGQQTLLVDLDPQCNATSALGRQPTASHPLVGGIPIRQAVCQTDIAQLDLLPGSRSFRDVEVLTRQDEAGAARLSEQLVRGLSSYDFVLIDCPPSLGPLTRTALASSNEILMPIQCEYFAMEGLAQMIETIGQIMQGEAHNLQFGGIVLTMYDHTLELTREVDEEVREFFGEIVYQTVVPRDAAVSEAPSHGKTVMHYAPRSRGARAYVELCMEVLERE
jgi:chromosome partitioning protein